MATGFFDSNGIWNYGEDDNIALFSDTLNKLADSTSDAFTADRSRLNTLESGSLAGLIPVKPTSVVVATGTAATNTLGVVTFTGATSLSLNGVFTTEYRNYRVIIQADASVAHQLRMRMRASGADNGSTDYQSALAMTQAFSSTSVSAYTGWQATYFVLGDLGTLDGHFTLDVINPQINTTTRMSHNGGSFDSTAIYRGYAGGLQHNIVSSYDGFTIFASTGNFTGTIQVFGYND